MNKYVSSTEEMIAEQMVSRPGSCLSDTDELIAKTAAGNMVIIVNKGEREDEGSLVMPAQFATADVINFMAKNARGLICLALTSERIRDLRLPMMAGTESDGKPAFTVSIEAAHGVTTGISAADRAWTIAVATSPQTRPHDIATPGHVFPLRARDGGTLVQAGHTEAAVDLACCAGLIPASVMCKIMNDDGRMSRLSELATFSDLHRIRIGSVIELAAYRCRSERLVEQVSVSSLHHPIFGEWRMHTFRNVLDGSEHIAMLKGDVEQCSFPVHAKLHFADLLADLLLRSVHDPIASAMAEIAAEGRGIVVVVADARKDATSSRRPHDIRPGSAASHEHAHRVGAQILTALGIDKVVLLAPGQGTAVSLRDKGIAVMCEREINRKPSDDAKEIGR